MFNLRHTLRVCACVCVRACACVCVHIRRRSFTHLTAWMAVRCRARNLFSLLFLGARVGVWSSFTWFNSVVECARIRVCVFGDDWAICACRTYANTVTGLAPASRRPPTPLLRRDRKPLLHLGRASCLLHHHQHPLLTPTTAPPTNPAGWWDWNDCGGK